MGNHRSSRWPRGYEKKTCVGECRRLSPREAPHAGISTVTTEMPRGCGSRRWCLCPLCGKRKGDLFQRAGSDAWACRECHGLTYRARQRRRARVLSLEDHPPFLEWAQRHPLTKAWLQHRSKTPLHESTIKQFESELWELLSTEYNAEYARLSSIG